MTSGSGGFRWAPPVSNAISGIVPSQRTVRDVVEALYVAASFERWQEPVVGCGSCDARWGKVRLL